MPSGLRSEALRGISTSLRRVDSVLLTCRLAEYRAAVAGGGVLAGAAAVVIKDLHPSDVEDYLSSTTGDAHHGSRWTEVLANIDNAAPGTTAAALQKALRTPLMVQLARTVYQNPKSRPEELLELGETKSIEDLLLDQYVAAALDPGPGMRSRHQRSLRRAERYLSHIAQYMIEAETPYFRWWDLHRCLNLKARTLLGVVVGLLVVIAEFALSFVFFGFILSSYDTSNEEPVDSGLTSSQESVVTLLYILLPILAAGIAIGFFVARYVQKGDPSNSVAILVPVRLRRTWRRNGRGRLTRRTRRQTLFLALRLGVIVGLVNGLALTVPFAIESVLAEEEWSGPLEVIVVTLFVWLSMSLGTALVFTFALLAAFQLGQLIEEPVVLTQVSSPMALLKSDRRTSILEAVISVVVALIICAIMTVPAYLIQSLMFGTSAELSFSDVFFGSAVTTIPPALTLTVVVIIVLTAWGRFTLTRLYFGCTGRFPFRLLRFLSSMRKKGVMRQTGPAFQFRHLRLRDRLAVHEPGSQTR